VAALAVAGCVAVWVGDPTTPGGILPVCPTKALLGIDCPGCGTLRAVYSLLHLDLGAALRFNALGVVALAVLAAAWVSATVGAATGRRTWSPSRVPWLPRVTLVVVLAWLVVRNLPWAPFTALHV
jgi:hypothetical protein